MRLSLESVHFQREGALTLDYNKRIIDYREGQNADFFVLLYVKYPAVVSMSRQPAKLNTHADFVDVSSYHNRDSQHGTVSLSPEFNAGEYNVHFNNSTSVNEVSKLLPVRISIPHCFGNITEKNRYISLSAEYVDATGTKRQVDVAKTALTPGFYSGSSLALELSKQFPIPGTQTNVFQWEFQEDSGERTYFNCRCSVDMATVIPLFVPGLAGQGFTFVHMTAHKDFFDTVGWGSSITGSVLNGICSMSLLVVSETPYDNSNQLLGERSMTTDADLVLVYTTNIDYVRGQVIKPGSVPFCPVNLKGLSKIYVCLTNVLNHANFITTNGHNNVLACVDMSNTEYGNVAVFNTDDIYVYGMEFTQVVDLRRFNIKLFDQNWDSVYIPPSYDVTCIVKIFHEDRNYS
jgi:hypothetical protein